MSKKRTLNFLIILLFIIYMGASRSSYLNNEYEVIVAAIEKFKPSNECVLNVSIKREWPFSWTPLSMSVSAENRDLEIETTTSKFFLPNRNVDKGVYTYHFEWETVSNNLVYPTYLDVKINRSKKVEWLNIGQCAVVDKETYFSSEFKGCRNETKIDEIKCT